MLAFAPALSYASPVGGIVHAGVASIDGAGTGRVTINQSTNKAIIDWSGYDLSAGESVRYAQPSSSSVTLNRIHDTKASQIDGNITANGNVWLVNPHGMIFGQGARVNVGGLVATSSDIENSRFMRGDYRFSKPGDTNAAVVNRGEITVKDSGLAALVAPGVANDGIISANLGKVALASGDSFTVDLFGDGLINLAVSDGVTEQLVINSGLITAEGGNVLLTAAQAGDVVNSLIVNSGVIASQTKGGKAGSVKLFAEGSNAVKNNIAANKGKKPGSSTVLNSGLIDASGSDAGEKGGTIELLADDVGVLNGSLLNASGDAGGGIIHIGGDYLGGGSTPTANNSFVDTYTLMYNDAITRGNGGRTIVWADGDTAFYGNIYGRGGVQGGNGGFTETSGKEYLDAQGFVDLTAPNGSKGTYLLDPANVTIYGNVDPAFVSTDSSINLAANLKLWLDSADASKVTLTYSTDGIAAATASGTIATNTITTSADVSATLAVGARIRINGAGAVTAASTLGADTYTIAAIAGTTITTVEPLTQTYAPGASLYRGLVSQWADKSGLNNHVTQAVENEMPMWLDNSLNGRATLKFDDIDDQLANAATVGGVTGSTLFTSWAPDNDLIYNLFLSKQLDSYYRWNGDGNGYFAMFRDTTRVNAYPIAMPSNGTHLLSLVSSTTDYNAWLDGEDKGGAAADYSAGDQVRIGYGPVAGFYNGKLMDVIVAGEALSANARQLIEQYQSAKWNVALSAPGTGATEADKAMAADGYSVFTSRYLERLSQSANVSLQATNTITLDLKGDTLALANDRNLSLTTTNGNISAVSAGSITTNRTGAGGNITMNAGGAGNIDLSNFSLTASGGGVIDLIAGGTVNAVSPNALSVHTVSGTSVLLQTTGANNITLGAGGGVTASAAGNSIVLASGNNFVNNAGAAALNPGAGRFLIYSVDPALDTLGGLTADSLYSKTYATDAPGTIVAAGNQFVYSVAAPVVPSGGGGHGGPIFIPPVTVPVTPVSTPVSVVAPAADTASPSTPSDALEAIIQNTIQRSVDLVTNAYTEVQPAALDDSSDTASRSRRKDDGDGDTSSGSGDNAAPPTPHGTTTVCAQGGVSSAVPACVDVEI